MLDGDCPYPLHWPTLIIGVSAAHALFWGAILAYMMLFGDKRSR